MLQRLDAMLQRADLSVRFRLMGRIVARLGAKAHPGLLSWALGVRPLEIRPVGVLLLIRALWR